LALASRQCLPKVAAAHVNCYTMAGSIHLHRVYDPVEKNPGVCFLVVRLWPRGVKKSALHFDAWLKDVAPSTDLRKWFNHDPDKWPEFQRRYIKELKSAPAAWQPIATAARRGRVTLLYSSHDAEHNNAVALKSFVDKQLKRTTRRAKAA